MKNTIFTAKTQVYPKRNLKIPAISKINRFFVGYFTGVLRSRLSSVDDESPSFLPQFFIVSLCRGKHYKAIDIYEFPERFDLLIDIDPTSFTVDEAQDLPRIAVYVTGDVPENEKTALRTEVMYGARTANAYEGNDARLGYGLTARIGAGVRF
ncbi:MAG: hypothetical protein LBC84_09800 [Prevotellaceae bacterium]|jgi:hypothetical protein|nr:hypothetical protein [Prevotellaceae bacterium]